LFASQDVEITTVNMCDCWSLSLSAYTGSCRQIAVKSWEGFGCRTVNSQLG